MGNGNEGQGGASADVRLIGLSGAYKGNEYVIKDAEFLIGRAKECQLPLDESTISGKHAKITKVGDKFEIHDLNSTNGTFVNGVKVERKGLRTNDKIKVDVFEFRYINPAEVERTVVSEAPDFSKPEKTVVRPQEAIKEPAAPPPAAAPPPQPQQAAPPPQAAAPQPQPVAPQPQPVGPQQRVNSPAFHKKGSIIAGLIIGLIVAYIFSYGGSFVGSWSKSNFNMNNIQTDLIAGLKSFPINHMHTAYLPWPSAQQEMLAKIVTIVCLALGLLLGGVITQSIGRKNRFLTSIVFTIFFVAIGLAGQLGGFNFNFQDWQMRAFQPANLGITDTNMNLAASIGYFTGVSFVISFIGTLLGRK